MGVFLSRTLRLRKQLGFKGLCSLPIWTCSENTQARRGGILEAPTLQFLPRVNQDGPVRVGAPTGLYDRDGRDLLKLSLIDTVTAPW